MNFTAQLLTGAAHVVDLPGDMVASLLTLLAGNAGLFPDGSPDGWLGILMSALAGVAAAMATAIILTVHFRSGYRRGGDILRYGLATAAAVGLVAFVAHDIRHATLAYLGINPSNPSIEFEIRLPKAAVSTLADSQVELHTDRNQTLARVRRALSLDDDGRSVLGGSVSLDYHTRDRVIILNLPGQAQCEFKLRLAASPSHSEHFGPWHLADRVAFMNAAGPARTEPTDAFAIRYRVL
jgi:hypothetical protein